MRQYKSGVDIINFFSHFKFVSLKTYINSWIKMGLIRLVVRVLVGLAFLGAVISKPSKQVKFKEKYKSGYNTFFFNYSQVIIIVILLAFKYHNSNLVYLSKTFCLIGLFSLWYIRNSHLSNLKPVLLFLMGRKTRAGKTGIIFIIYYFDICRKLSVIRCFTWISFFNILKAYYIKSSLLSSKTTE